MKAVATWWITEFLVRKAGCIYGNSRRVIARRTSVHAAAQVLFGLLTVLAWHTRCFATLVKTDDVLWRDWDVTADSCLIQLWSLCELSFFAFAFRLSSVIRDCDNIAIFSSLSTASVAALFRMRFCLFSSSQRSGRLAATRCDRRPLRCCWRWFRVFFHRVSCVHRSAVQHDKLNDVHRLFFFLIFTLMRFFPALLFSTGAESWWQHCSYHGASASLLMLSRGFVGLDTSSQQISFYCGSVHFNP
jgi:hypothetical protein